MIDFSNVNRIVIPEGEVSVIARGIEILWRKQKYKRELEYIEGTGTQYIDTGLDYFADFEVGLKLRNNVSNKAFGNGSNCCLQRKSVTEPYWQFSSPKKSFITSVPITEYHIMKWKDNAVYADGIKLGTQQKDANAGNRMYLFAVTNNGVVYPCMFYSCKLWDNNGNLVRDFIPVIDWNDAPCMYDKVSDELFYNAGAGEFLYG